MGNQNTLVLQNARPRGAGGCAKVARGLRQGHVENRSQDQSLGGLILIGRIERIGFIGEGPQAAPAVPLRRCDNVTQ
jgi:hypothetical protein